MFEPPCLYDSYHMVIKSLNQLHNQIGNLFLIGVSVTIAHGWWKGSKTFQLSLNFLYMYGLFELSELFRQKSCVWNDYRIDLISWKPIKCEIIFSIFLFLFKNHIQNEIVIALYITQKDECPCTFQMRMKSFSHTYFNNRANVVVISRKIIVKSDTNF